ncbi:MULTISPECIES: DUF6221 family protein [unclassified Streptomyces]|uniref:DUF6221 family protein n=1 Tax=unclassified Streptomyces TaxID=2593676 RepID=UPI0033DF6364
MDDLVQWLRAQLDEDERIARAADGELSAVFTRVASFDPEMAADERHIMAHGPVRVLRDIDVQRQLLALHAPGETGYVDGTVCMVCEDADVADEGPFYPCKTLRLLALRYADRSGYREEWRP